MPSSRGRKKKGKGGKAAIPPALQSRPPAERHWLPHLKLIRHKWWFLAAEWIVGAALFLLGLGASIQGIWGPPWPTSPSFSPGAASFGDAFDIPFQVENKSLFFGLSNLKIGCKFLHAELFFNEKTGMNLNNAVMAAFGANSIAAATTAQFTCPIRGRIGVETPNGTLDLSRFLKTAVMSFVSEYDSRLLWGQSHSEDGPYTWDSVASPPRWERGFRLK